MLKQIQELGGGASLVNLSNEMRIECSGPSTLVYTVLRVRFHCLHTGSLGFSLQFWGFPMYFNVENSKVLRTGHVADFCKGWLK